MTETAILSVEEMYKADALTIAGGVPGLDLMEAAGTAIVNEICHRWKPRPVTILCGPGNNGGDGFVVARLLKKKDWPVSLALLGTADKVSGDAAINAKRWDGDILPLDDDRLLDDNPLVVDALFGAGLARPLEGRVRDLVDRINLLGLDCVGVDVPSGIDGNTGQVLGAALRCLFTVTFFKPKPGHLLMPGRDYAGAVKIADIGIKPAVLESIRPTVSVNAPPVWLADFPRHDLQGHKYGRGHGLILGGAQMTGAARLAAQGARRAGAGLVTIAAPKDAFVIYASDQPGTLVSPLKKDGDFEALLTHDKIGYLLLGPGAGVSEETRERVWAALATKKPIILDADALTVYGDNPDKLFGAIQGPCLMTPHDGEFRRLFPDLGPDMGKLDRCRKAAERSGAVILLKGPDTVIANPGGQAVINANAPASLATAGSGDVLAGIALGLVCQGMDIFKAGAAAAWMHGAAAKTFGPGLIAEDLPATLPDVLKHLYDLMD